MATLRESLRITAMNTISILGCGWLGLPLGKHLVNKGYRIKGSTTHASKLSIIRMSGIQPFLVSLEPEFKGEGHFLDSDVLVLNLPPINISTEKNFYRQQLLAIRTSIQKSSISKVIFISSTSVYPNIDQLVHENDASYEALSRSGISLLAMEDIIRDSVTYETTIVRFGGLYGPERHPGNFLTGKHNLPGKENPVNMTHLEDGIGSIDSIIEHNIWGQTFNVCSPNHPSRINFYTQAALDIGKEPPTFSDEIQPYKIVSSEKFASLSGYQFMY